MIDPRNEALRLKQLPLLEGIEEAASSVITPEEANRISEMARLALEELGRSEGAAPEWLEDYRRLREVGWPWRVACYIAWAASPKLRRSPRSQEELATRFLGLTSDRQVATWRRKNPVIDETITMLQAQPLLEHRRDIYEALVESATNPDYKGHQDRELALKLLGDYTDKRDVRISGSLSGKDLTERSDEELRSLAGGLSTDDGGSDHDALNEDEE